MYGGKQRFKKSKIRVIGYEFDVPDIRSFLWQFKEIFVEEYYRFETNLTSPVIFDCGANVGTSCAFFKLIYPQSKIVAFEPNPIIADYLRSNIKNNSLQNIEVIEKAVWINNDGIELGLDDADSSSIHLDKNKTKVGSVRLKELLEREQTVDMLKLDIEGSEVDVLKDCYGSLSNVRNLFVEFHCYVGQPQRLSEITKVLEAAGFRYFIMQPESRSRPFLNKTNKFNPEMDLQLNIFAYRI
jgi:FkbM family methyltransferase